MLLTTLDIETAPALVHSWGLFKATIGINQIVRPVEMLCFAAKAHGDRNVEFYSTYHDGKERMVEEAWRILDESDAIIHYNGRQFDIPHLQREFALMGMRPPSPFAQIDLLTTVRSKLKFESRKLDFVAQQLGIGGKVKHTGFELWLQVMNDDPKAWELMKKYCIGDVKLEEKLYDRLLPWITNHPSVPLIDGTESGCPNCGSFSRQHRGYAMTATRKYLRYQCQGCGRWYRGAHSVASTDAR